MYLEKILKAIVNMDEDNIINKIEEALNNGITPEEIYNDGLGKGMLEVTKLFEEKKYFVSEVIVCADTLNMGVKYLQRKYPKKNKENAIKIVFSVVEGDLHEIGKNIVKIMFEAAGFKVFDLGVNVKAKDVIEKAKKENVHIIALSTMMTTTMIKMKDVVELLKLEKIEKKPKIIIGGGCINQQYADEIGADGYSSNAIEAVQLVNRLMGVI